MSEKADGGYEGGKKELREKMNLSWAGAIVFDEFEQLALAEGERRERKKIVGILEKKYIPIRGICKVADELYELTMKEITGGEL
jgi:hypothetical protein